MTTTATCIWCGDPAGADIDEWIDEGATETFGPLVVKIDGTYHEACWSTYCERNDIDETTAALYIEESTSEGTPMDLEDFRLYATFYPNGVL